jgi:hypothetical protein
MQIKGIFIGAVFLLLASSALAQPDLSKEIDRMVAALIEQINAYPEIRTVGIDDFTTTDFQPNALGRYLADEFMTAFVMSREKKFLMLSRQKVKTLMNEAKLDAKGVLAPGNAPRLDQIKGVDVIIGATMMSFTNNIRLNVSGIHLETTGVLAATRDIVTFTPAMRKLYGANTSEQTGPGATSSSSQSPITYSEFTHQNIKISLKGCSISGQKNKCTLSMVSEGADTELSLYAQKSYASINGSRVKPTHAELGNISGSTRVSNILYSDKSYDLSLEIPGSGITSSLELTFYSNQHGLFKAKFDSIP